MLHSFYSGVFADWSSLWKYNKTLESLIIVLKHYYSWMGMWNTGQIVGEKCCSGKPLSPFKVKEIKQFGIWKKITLKDKGI